MYQGAVDLLADSAVSAVNDVFDVGSIRQRDMRQVAEHVVSIGGDLAGCGVGLGF